MVKKASNKNYVKWKRLVVTHTGDKNDEWTVFLSQRLTLMRYRTWIYLVILFFCTTKCVRAVFSISILFESKTKRPSPLPIYCNSPLLSLPHFLRRNRKFLPFRYIFRSYWPIGGSIHIGGTCGRTVQRSASPFVRFDTKTGFIGNATLWGGLSGFMIISITSVWEQTTIGFLASMDIEFCKIDICFVHLAVA